jgi:hypothetical protein
MRWDVDEVEVAVAEVAAEVVALAAKAARRLLVLVATVFAPTVVTKLLTKSGSLAMKWNAPNAIRKWCANKVSRWQSRRT